MALNIVIGDATIGVQGEDFSYLFSTSIGGMESLYKYGKEWLYRAPKPTFWRATTDNDRGNGFSYRSAVWLAVHSPASPHYPRQAWYLPSAPRW